MRHRSASTGKKAFVGGVLVGLVFAVVAVSAEAAPRDLKIATEGAYPPFNYVDGQEPAGFEVELGRALCAAAETRCSFVLQDWDSMITGLKEGRYDAIMSSMEITPERRRRITFSKPYYRIPSALIGTKEAAPAPPILAGKTVGTTADSEFETYLGSLKGVEVRTYAKFEEADLDLLTGRLDYVLGDKLEMWKFLESREGKMCCRFVADLPVDRGEGVGIGLRRGDPELVALFNDAIDKVMAGGTYDRIRAKYFPFSIR